MKGERKSKGIINVILTLLMLFVAVISGQAGLSAFADTTAYSDVLKDLQKDESFNISDYPDKAEDYSLNVIQIAESKGGELLLYTYQSSQKTKYLIATDINMSLSESVDGTKLYRLKLLSVNGVFCKYFVTGVTVSSDSVRYYNITSIYRAWDKAIDSGTGNDNTVSGVSYAVGQLWTAETVNGELHYYRIENNVVNVTEKYVGSLRYKNGVSGLLVPVSDYTDSHFIAFSTDYDMTELYDADIAFNVQKRQAKYNSDMDYYLNNPPDLDFAYGNAESKKITVAREEIGSNTPAGWFKSNYYSWNRIQTVDNFKKNCGLTLSDELQKNLNGKQWILQFYESSYIYRPFGGTSTVDYYSVSDETILRLHFMSKGEEYNLGVVDNKQTGDKIPDGVTPQFDFWQWLADLMHVPRWAAQLIFWGVIVAIVLLIFMPILSLIFPVIKPIVNRVFTAIWWVISLPFRGIAALIRKRTDKPESEEQTKQLSEPKKRSSKPKRKKNGAKNEKKSRK